MKIQRTKPAGDLRRFLDAQKNETVVLGPVERHLLKRAEKPRRQDILHPSELCKTNFCELSAYYRVLGRKRFTDNEATKPSFQLQRIFDEGHEIHHKWQGYIAEAGLLEGTWECPSTTCGHRFWACAPTACPRCNHVGRNQGTFTNMIYKEVQLDAEESHMIVGHADGKVGRRILEIKSIGAGTVRIEAPGLLAQHTHKARVVDEDGNLEDEPRTFTDWNGLWKGIKRPLNSHQRQAHLYVALAKMQGIDVDGVVFLYESKWNQGSKEFVVPYNEKFAEPLLEKALDIRYAIKNNRPPRCPTNGCKECEPYEVYDREHGSGEGDAPSAQRGSGDSGGVSEGAGEAAAAGAGAPGEARAGDAESPRRALRSGRRPADGAVRDADSVGRLPLGAARRS